MKPEAVIQEQVDAYNSRDIERFLACHHSLAELYNFPDHVPYATGQPGIREIYQDIFENSPDLHTQILKRIVMGNIVIDHEVVTGRKGVDTSEIIAIYEIENESIKSARFIRKE